MKTIVILITILFIQGNVIAQQVQSQPSCDTCMYDANSVYVVVNEVYLDTQYELTNPSIFASILNIQDVVAKHCFAHSHDTFIKRVYKVISASNAAYMHQIFSQSNQIIDYTERCPKALQSAANDYDPSDYFWTWQPNLMWHLSKIEADKAWDITKGNPNIKIATIDTWFDLNHPDLANKFIVNYDPYDNTVFTMPNCSSHYDHGTTAASFIAAETDGGGFLSGLGFNCKLVGYQAWDGDYLERAHHASFVMGADVITSSAGGWYCPNANNFSLIHQKAVKDILDNGTVIVMPAGNGFDTGGNCHDGTSYRPFSPLSPEYDERVIVVSSTDIEDKHYFFNTNPNIGYGIGEMTHSHFSSVDVCAPGYLTTGALCSVDGSHPYYDKCHGTSFSTPIVAGLAGLIKSINPCFSAADVQEIIKTTTDPIADEASYSGLVGTGRINAYEAVKKALIYKAMYEQNKTYQPNPSIYENKAHTIITGYSVTGNLPNGWVTIPTGTKVKYTARNFIEAKYGYEAQQSSQFEWRIAPNLNPCDDGTGIIIDEPPPNIPPNEGGGEPPTPQPDPQPNPDGGN